MRTESKALTRVISAAIAAVALAFITGGCASYRPAGDLPVSDELVLPERRWNCLPLDGPGADQFSGRAESWSVDGGNMLSVYRTRHKEPDPPGLATRSAAMAGAAASAADAALELLGQRGVAYDEERRREIVDEVVSATVRGADIPFPRMEIVARGWEECIADADGGSAVRDTTWLAAILVEYPIGYLRGDVNNVLWERSRAANEAEILKASAEEHLSAGRWHDGLLDAARVAGVVLATGVPITIADDVPQHTLTQEPISVGARLRALLRWSRAATGTAETLDAQVTGGVAVVEVGAAANAIVKFHCTYRWNGRTIPAVGVPVRFEMLGASAVLDADPLTDGSGTATCRIAAAYGAPGAYGLGVSLDIAAADAAVSRSSRSPEVPLYSNVARQVDLSRVLAHRTVHLVVGAHAISVCAEFGESTDADAAQVMSGFSRRMERDGYRLGACDPDVDVGGTLRIGVRPAHRVWAGHDPDHCDRDRRGGGSEGRTARSGGACSQRGGPAPGRLLWPAYSGVRRVARAHGEPQAGAPRIPRSLRRVRYDHVESALGIPILKREEPPAIS